ncbi:MAG: class I SAM-dependent rRNA methyltransferase [Steroidobacteraceae bacterium]
MNIPSPTGLLAELRLLPREERRLRAGHVWVFANEVDNRHSPLKSFAPGSQARLLSARGELLGFVYVNPHSLICARLVADPSEGPLGEELIALRLERALECRQQLYSDPWYRVVFGEADRLPGLILDRYGDVLVGQIATCGMEALRPALERAVDRVLKPAALLWKNDSSARDLEGLAHEQRWVGAAPAMLEVREGPLRFQLPFTGLQKTGWFYDQRDNRQRLRRHVVRGARVLDVFSYAGAWASTALAAGAGSALAVDSSAGALANAVACARDNGFELETLQSDAFDALEQLHARGERFDIVIIDPPALAKRRRDLARARAAYRKLNQLAMRCLHDQGLLVSASCSYHLAEADLLAEIAHAARQSGVFAQVLEVGGQSADHPFLPAVAETRYLKVFFCRIARLPNR